MIADRSSLPLLEGLPNANSAKASAPTAPSAPAQFDTLLGSGEAGALLSLPPWTRRSRRTGPTCFAPGCRHPILAKGALGLSLPDFENRLILPPVPVTANEGPVPATHFAKFELAAIDPGDDFVLQLYLRDIAKTQTGSLLAAPEQALLDDTGREQLVVNHLHRVVRMAFEYRGLGLSIGDLVNEGNIGLLRAAQLFDPTRKVQFYHYAKVWIRMQMKRALSYQSLPVSLPADFSWRRGQVLGAEERLTKTLNREPKETELATECGLELPAVRRIRNTPPPTFVTFETPCCGRAEGYTLAETIPDETIATPEKEAVHNSDLEFMQELVAALPPYQQQVIRLRFGLDDGCARTLEEVAQLLGYVRQGIHRIETSALHSLRQHARFLELGSESASLRTRFQSCERIARSIESFRFS